MKHTIIIDGLQPISVNSMYNAGSARFGKRTAAKDWTHTVFYKMSYPSNIQKFAELRQHFDPKKHYLKLHLRAYFPKAQLFTKDGTPSARCIDLTNWEKPFVDCLLLSKFFNVPSPYGAENLNTDDKYVLSCLSEKLIADDDKHRLEADIEILEINVKYDIG